MELSITSVTKSRKFTKALSRVSISFEPVEKDLEEIDSSMENFDVLQFVFQDKDESYVQIKGTKNDRIYQVIVGIPNFESDDHLFSLLVEIILNSFEKIDLSNETKQQCIEQFQKKL